MTALVLDVAGARLRVGGAGGDAFAVAVPVLRLRRGERVAVVGPSGCGKSLLLEFLALLVRPAGIDRFVLATAADDRRDLTGDIAAGRIDALARLRAGPLGYVPQSGGVLPFLSARAHATAGLRLAGRWRDPEARARFDRIAEALGIGAHLAKTRDQLSGGQRKRVALLAGLSVPRRLLIADEPTAGLDAASGAAVMALLAGQAADEGTAILIATHDADAAHRAGFAVRALDRGSFLHDSREAAA